MFGKSKVEKETAEEAEKIAREGTVDSRKKLRTLELLASPEYRDQLTKFRMNKESKNLKQKIKARNPSSAEEAGAPRFSVGGAH